MNSKWMPLLGLGAAVAVHAAGNVDVPLRRAAQSYREGRLLAALTYSTEAMTQDPQNAVAKNYIWIITQELRKREVSLAPGETEEAAALARLRLKEHLRKTEKILAELRRAARQSGDLRSPSGLLTALGDLGQTLSSESGASLAGEKGQVFMSSILRNVERALEKQVFTTSADRARAEGYLAYYQGDRERAVALWEKALRDHPGDAQITKDLASLKDMVRREKDSETLRNLVAQAETFQETGLYARAEQAWKEVLALDPDHPGVREGMAAARVSLEKTRLQHKLEEMNEKAADLFRSGDSLGAAEIWLEALQMDPTFQKARVWLKLVGKQINREARPSTPAPVAATSKNDRRVSPVDSRLAEDLYKKGLLSYAEGELSRANDYWRKSLNADPGLKKAREALKQGESELSLLSPK